MKTYKYKILGLDCPNCANNLEQELNKITLINNLNINYLREILSFECEEQNITKAISQIKKITKKEEPDATIEDI